MQGLPPVRSAFAHNHRKHQAEGHATSADPSILSILQIRVQTKNTPASPRGCFLRSILFPSPSMGEG